MKKKKPCSSGQSKSYEWRNRREIFDGVEKGNLAKTRRLLNIVVKYVVQALVQTIRYHI